MDVTEANIQNVQERFMQLFEIEVRKLRWENSRAKPGDNDQLIYKGSAITAAENAMKQVNRELLLSGCPYKETWMCKR